MFENDYFLLFCFVFCQLLSVPEEYRKMLYEAEMNNRLVPHTREQLASEALPDSPEHQGSWMQRGNVLYWSISSGLFCFLLIPDYSFIWAYIWGALRTVTMQQAEAADANEGGREEHTYKWEKNLAQCPLFTFYNPGKAKYCCWQYQLLTVIAQ